MGRISVRSASVTATNVTCPKCKKSWVGNWSKAQKTRKCIWCGKEFEK